MVVRLSFLLGMVLSSLAATGALAWAAQAPPPAARVTPDPWPRTLTIDGATLGLYQPQVDAWDGQRIEATAAVSVVPQGAKEPMFGMIDLAATTRVDRSARTVEFAGIVVRKAVFPGSPGRAEEFQRAFQRMVERGPSTMSLDRLEAMLAIAGAQRQARTVPVDNSPPRIVLSTRSAVLVPVDGEPVWRAVPGGALERVLNSRALLVRAGASGPIYLHLFDGFLTAPTLAGPWTGPARVPPEVEDAARTLAREGVVDLMEVPRGDGPASDKKGPTPSRTGGVPDVIVAVTPTELIVMDGPPEWVPIQNSALVYVRNTTGNVFLYLQDQRTYVLVSGRWFRGAYLAGPWTYVPAEELPPDFARIPDDSPKENVKASIPGTPQAEAAVIANGIPQMATVERTAARFAPVIDGAPEIRPIEGTAMSYVANSPQPIVSVSPSEWYAVDDGVWFTAPAALGPWVVAAAVPPAIYAIPPTSPVHYVTYVRIYDVTPRYVVVGYTPGYLGTLVAPSGVVVYGTGYAYAPYIGHSVWYAVPATYGYAAAVAWTPWTGWSMGFGFGLAFGAAVAGTSRCCWGYCPAPHWGAMPYAPRYGAVSGPRGTVAWGPGGWAGTSANVYRRWGPTTVSTRATAGYNAWTGSAWSSKLGHSYNSVTGRISAGQRASVANVYTGNYASAQRSATYNPSTGVAARGGSATVGNVNTGQQSTARWGQVSGPGGSTVSAARVGNDYYASRDGNVYRNTGNGWQHYGGGSWSTVDRPSQLPALQSQQQARAAGDARSAGATWGSPAWGSGFSQPRAAAGPPSAGGWDRGAAPASGARAWEGGNFQRARGPRR